MTTSKLAITLFGSPQFRLDGATVDGFATRKAQALLIYLAAHPRPFRRELLAGMFWAEKGESEAKNNLRRVLPDLRRRFGDYLTIDRQAIEFERRQPFWLDVEQFEAATRLMHQRPLPDADVDTLEAALALYTGEFLAGFNLSEAPAFEEWVTYQREHLRERALRGLNFITEHFVQTRQLQRGLAASHRLLALEPWHEVGYQQRMILLAWNGERAAALHQYELCKRMLADEFGLAPGGETADLHARIKAGEFDPLVPPIQVETPAAAHAPGLEDVPRQPLFVGRTAELAQLRSWHAEKSGAIIAVLGVGGAGKTALAAHYVRSSAEQSENPPPFDRVLWASLLNAPPLASLLRIWLRALAVQSAADLSYDVDELLARLFPHLRSQRCLLVLDNVESIMQEGAERGAFRNGYKEYGRLLQRLVELPHASTLLLTSRELPAVLARAGGVRDNTVRTLALGGLPAASGAELLVHAGLARTSPAIDELVRHYSGIPLALKLVADTVRTLYGGDLDAFLTHGMPLFGDIRTVLDEQTARLTPLELEVLTWLAIERESVAVNRVLESLIGPLDRHTILHTLNRLLHTSLVERDQVNESSGPVRLTLQNVVMEYMTDRLLVAFDDDLARLEGETFRRYPLLLASAPEHVQVSQRRLLLQRVADQACARWGAAGAIERLHGMLDRLRRTGLATTGYGAANVLHLLLTLDADVHGLNLSHMAVCQADLRTATLNAVNLTGTDLTGTIFAGTFGVIDSVTASPDGRLVAAGGSDGVIYLWRSGDFELVNTLKRHTVITTVAFSSDSRLLLSSGLDGLICLWDVASGALVGAVDTPERPIICTALHPDGTIVAAAGTDETVRVWEWRSGVLLGLLRAPSVLTGLAYSPDGRTLVSVGDERAICLWDTADNTLRQQRHGHAGKVEAVAFHPDGELFATGGEDGRICLWDLHNRAPLHTLDGHTDFVLSLAFASDGELLASCGADQVARIWSVTSGALRRVITGHRGWVNAVAFGANGHTVITGGYDQSVRIWNPGSGRLEHFLKGHLRWVDYVTFSGDRGLLASCSLDGPVRLWDARSGALLHSLRGPEAATRILAFSRCGTLLATAGDDYRIRIWHTQSGELLCTLRGHSGSVRNVFFDRDVCTLVSAGHDGTLRIWDIKTGQTTRVVANVNATNRLAIVYEPRRGLLAYATQEHTVAVEELATGRVEAFFATGEMSPSIVAFDRSGRWLACGTNEGAILLYDLADRATPGIPVHVVPASGAPVWRLLFSPDSATLGWIRTDQVIQLLDLHNKSVSCNLLTYFGAFCLGFSHDGAHVISDGPENTVQVRSTTTGELLRTLHGHAGGITCIAVSDDDTIASSSNDGSIRLWDPLTGQCLASLQTPGPYAGMAIRGARGITPAQRATLQLLGAQA